MSTPNKVAAFVCVDYADKHTNQDTRRCRCIAHTADLSALIDINPSYFLTCHPERNRVILSTFVPLSVNSAKDLTPGTRCFGALSMTMLSLTAVHSLRTPPIHRPLRAPGSTRRLKFDGLVGADLSRTPPIYRPSLAFPISIQYMKNHNLTLLAHN